MALQRERCSPWGVVGPVPFKTRRLASICLRGIIANRTEQLASFRHFDAPRPQCGQARCGLVLFPFPLPIYEGLTGPKELVEGAIGAKALTPRPSAPAAIAPTRPFRHHSDAIRGDGLCTAAR